MQKSDTTTSPADSAAVNSHVKVESYASAENKVAATVAGSYTDAEKPAQQIPDNNQPALKLLYALKVEITPEQLQQFDEILTQHSIATFIRAGKFFMHGTRQQISEVLEALYDANILDLQPGHTRSEMLLASSEIFVKSVVQVPFTGGTLQSGRAEDQFRHRILESSDAASQKEASESSSEILSKLRIWSDESASVPESLTESVVPALAELSQPASSVLPVESLVPVREAPVFTEDSVEDSAATQEDTATQEGTATPTGAPAAAVPWLPPGIAGNSAPTMSNLSIPLTFAENTVNATAQVMQAAMTMSDPDSSDFNTGYLRVNYTGGTVNDQLSIVNTGGITTVAADVFYLGVLIGTIATNGVNGANLRIDFNASASRPAVEALLKAIGYANNSNQAAASRTLNVTLDDGDGGASSANFVVNVTPETDTIIHILTAGADNFVGDSDTQIYQTTSANFNAADSLPGGTGTDTIQFTNTVTINAATLLNKTGIDRLVFDGSWNDVTLSDAFIDASDDGTNLEVANGTSTILPLNTSAVSATNNVIIAGTGTVYLANVVHNRVVAKDGVNTSITTGTGNDTVIGGTGNDTIALARGGVSIGGGEGDDSVSAGAGDDTVSCAISELAGADTINGGSGSDTLLLQYNGDITAAMLTNVSGFETYTISDSTASRSMTFGANPASSTGNITVSASSTTIFTFDASASSENFTVQTRVAGGGNDTLTGGSGNDTFHSYVGNDRLVGNGGADNFSGGVGADNIFCGTADGAQDRVNYLATDNGAAAGTNTGYDTISQFEQALDRIAFTTNFNSVAGASVVDDIADDDTFVFATNQTTNFNTTHEALLITGLLDADLIQANFVNIRTALNGYGITAANAENGIIVVQGASQTGIFYYQETEGGGNTTISASDLRLLAISNGVLDTTNILFG